MRDVRSALCIALDGTDLEWIEATARTVAPHAGWLKVGLEGFTAHGPDLVRRVGQLGSRIFLDLKLHDIPATVSRAAANCAVSGADMFNVHAGGGAAMLRAAVEGARSAATSQPPKVLAVTVLTSLDHQALSELGLPIAPDELVVRWARMAQSCGLDGVVASAKEAPLVRRACGPEFLIVTPGIRPAWAAGDDQKRIVTPAAAIADGADVLVIGRPVTRADDPAAAAQRILQEMSEGASAS
ncbi:MAG: orotidine-5'-phosphate decarboxylase [Acidobacteria bacterium]|jgi:orotidine-5'-phosphate decarboxylase|nr:orotidine-5'-phosphate decarboxylase [Acidobacteriota bacterium]